MVVVLVASTTLAACTVPSLIVDGSTVTVASAQPFTSFNDQSTFGNTPANSSIVGAVNAGFTYYNDKAELVGDESFGTVEIVSQEPFEVRYTVADDVTWSDGEPVDAADLLLSWAANSGHLNTEGFDASRYVDDETGQFTAFPEGVVYFDGANRSGLQHVSTLPQVGDDGRSITLRYDEYFVDWQLAFDVGLPAHVVALETGRRFVATDEESAASTAKKAVIDAITDANASSLAPLAVAWNSAFNAVEDPSLLVSSGPYVITKITPEESVTLTANPLYSGTRKPRFETVVVRTIADPLVAVGELRAGSVDVIAPNPSVDIVAALADLDDVEVVIGRSSVTEHIDLQFSGAKHSTFTDPLLREAFLLTVPREQIVRELVTPIDPDARVRESLVVRDGDGGFEQDVAAAAALVARSGVAPPPVCILFDPSNPRRVTEYELVKQSAEKAGFVVSNCSTSDWQGFLGVAGAYDAALFAWDESTTAVTASHARLQSNSTVSNFSNYSSPVVDALLDRLALEDDPEQQRELLDEVNDELMADSYGLPLYDYPSIVAYSRAIENVSTSPLSGLLWNVWQWQPAAEPE